MQARTRREALRAAAKVAVSVAALGSITCGGKTTEPEGAATGPIRSEISDAKPGLDRAACKRELDAVLAEAKAASAANEPIAKAEGALLVECCTAILGEWWDAARGGATTPVPPPPEHRETCCWAPGVEGVDHIGCLPWGPPTPPAFA